jgi:hypothetical protein
VANFFFEVIPFHLSFCGWFSFGGRICSARTAFAI